MRAQSAVAPLRRRLLMMQPTIDIDNAVDVKEIASVVCDCEVVFVSQLSEARVFSILATEYGVDIGNSPMPTNAPLAGALCMATNGFFRWIFVRDEDSDERKRFTMAHELGHLFLEAIPELERSASRLQIHSAFSGTPIELRVFSRCSDTDPSDTSSTRPARSPLSPADLREIHAHHFAAEVLMPYEGVRRLVARQSGTQGVRSHADLEQLVTHVARRYSVSMAAARRRLQKDLGLIPLENDPNGDLFG